jgi:hypothetical protein
MKTGLQRLQLSSSSGSGISHPALLLGALSSRCEREIVALRKKSLSYSSFGGA